MYLLASHVYLCVTDDHGILLDLKRDKYIGLSRAQMRALATRVQGWPTPAGPPVDAPSESQTQAFISKLLASGILTTDPALGKDAKPVALARPEASLATLDLAAGRDLFDVRPKIGSGQFLVFVWASLTARLALRLRSIARVASWVQARKARRDGAGACDIAAARSLVAVFVYLRPLLFTTKNACLADSLALSLFLAHYGLSPSWVFGVQTGPFAAHCWIQEGPVIFNDTPDHVRRYTPIMTL